MPEPKATSDDPADGAVGRLKFCAVPSGRFSPAGGLLELRPRLLDFQTPQMVGFPKTGDRDRRFLSFRHPEKGSDAPACDRCHPALEATPRNAVSVLARDQVQCGARVLATV